MVDSLLSGTHILIIIPGTVSYFYDAEGRRVAEALRNLGCIVDIATLQTLQTMQTMQTYSARHYDWGFFLNLWEIMFANEMNRRDTLREIQQIKGFCRRTGMILLEAVEMKWFRDSWKLFQQAKLDVLLDLGFHDQSSSLPRQAKSSYQFVFNGLTHSEQAQGAAYIGAKEERPIPWSFVGHMTPIRLTFLEFLMTHLDSNGLVYMVHFSPVTEAGPHLNEAQYMRALSRTSLNIWCSHHQYFYLESIRFRFSFLTGSLPLKVEYYQHKHDPTLPFLHFVVNPDNAVETIMRMDFHATRDQYIQEFCALPSLEDSLHNTILKLG